MRTLKDEYRLALSEFDREKILMLYKYLRSLLCEISKGFHLHGESVWYNLLDYIFDINKNNIPDWLLRVNKKIKDAWDKKAHPIVTLGHETTDDWYVECVQQLKVGDSA